MNPITVRKFALHMIMFVLSFVSVCKARADVPPGTVTHVYMNFGKKASDTQASQYGTFIASLRRAAGHDYREGVMITQQNNTTGLIQATLTNGGRTITLWITPQDLYVRGFTNAQGHTFQFNDPEYDLHDALNRLHANPPGGNTTLPFGGNYNSLARAGMGRESLHISFYAFNQAFNNLRDASDDRKKIAEALLLMIQLTSESARFEGIYQSAFASMRDGRVNNRLTQGQQHAENNWAALSNYALAVTQNPHTPPTTIRNVRVLNSFRDLVGLLAMIINRPYDAPGGIKGNWNHAEL